MNLKNFKGADIRKVIYIDEVRKLNNDNTTVGSSPYLVEIIPTPFCNANCTFCSYELRNSQNTKDKNILNINILENLIGQLSKSTKGIFIAGGGEPTTYKHLNKLISICKDKFDVGLCSNYQNLSYLSKDSILATRLHEWSIVAGDPQTYSNVTGNKEELFFNIENNIKYILDTCNDYDNFVIGKVLICKENYKTVNVILKYLEQFKLDSISLRLVNNYENKFKELDENEKNELLELANENKLDKLIELIKYNKNEKKLSRNCYTITEGHFVIIDCTGEVYLSVPDSTNDKYSIGNIKTKEWKDIWNSAEHQKIISELNTQYIEGKCDLNSCRHYNSNYVLEKMRDGELTKLPLKDFKENLGAFV
jgi:MoaA/NifB/PqqE/SkfB family radical SAM enzyme